MSRKHIRLEKPSSYSTFDWYDNNISHNPRLSYVGFYIPHTIILCNLVVHTHAGSLPETYPSIVDSRGHHMSYRVHLASNNLSEADMRTFFKLEAFGKQYLLNVSSSAHFLHNTQDHLPVVEYIGADGFTRSSKTMNHSRWCFHSGHVHLMAENGEYQEETLTDGWVAISSCSGLVGLLNCHNRY